MSEKKFIKVTYSTLASPDPLLHEYYEEAVAEVKADLGKTYLYVQQYMHEQSQTVVG